MTPFLVLFDIDGTLIHSGRAGVRALALAFDELFAAPEAVESVPFAGRTDRAIVIDVLAKIGRAPAPETIDAVRDAYCRRLLEEIARPVDAPKCVLPGVAAALDALEARNDVAVGLLTGNFVSGAEIKLGYFDLWRRFGFGAFGDAHVNRRDLVPLARARACDAGFSGCPPNRIIVIGDTPLDVDCAHAHGARAVAVATGPYDAAALAAAGADVIIDDLTDWPRAWDALSSAR